MIDLDNTLADRAAAVLEWAREFCHEHGLDAAAVERIVELDRDGYSHRSEVFATLAREFELAVPADELVEAYRHRIIAMTRRCTGAAECLAELREQGRTVVIVTNGSSRQQHGKIDTLDLRRLVDGVVVSEEMGIAKPDRRIFEQAARTVGSDLAGAWMVGDSAVHDVGGSAALGIRTAWLDRGRSWADQSLGEVEPDVAIGSLHELPRAIASVEG